MNIDKNGGVEYLTPDELKTAEDADLISLPIHLNHGINCSNCKFFRHMTGSVGHCGNKKVDLPVTDVQVCKLYDHPGVIRSWENKNV